MSKIILPKSPTQERDEFISKVFTLSKKYGINQLCVVFSQPYDSEKDKWCWKATADMEKIVEVLEEQVIPSFQDLD